VLRSKSKIAQVVKPDVPGHINLFEKEEEEVFLNAMPFCQMDRNFETCIMLVQAEPNARPQ